mgnify:CR=1 FL=1
MVLRFGRFLARSTTTTSVPISGPSTLMSEKMPAVCIFVRRGLTLALFDMVEEPTEELLKASAKAWVGY